VTLHPIQRRWHAEDLMRRRRLDDAERVLTAIERSGQTIEDFASEHGLRAQRIDPWVANSVPGHLPRQASTRSRRRRSALSIFACSSLTSVGLRRAPVGQRRG